MSKTVEYLLMPRYKVVTDWPGRKDFVVGEVITLDKDFSPQYKKYEITDCQGTRSYITSFFEMFPLQFKKLEWWEGREVSEMPDYLKFNDDKNTVLSLGGEQEPEIHKVKHHQRTSPIMDFRYSEYSAFISEWKNHCYSYNQFQPATESEYNQYIASKK